MHKEYVRVRVRYDMAGNITPLAIYWKDGRRFDIDRVLDVRRAASMGAGGCGIRYTCRIRNREKYLFQEEDRWFVEAKDQTDSGAPQGMGAS